jgi:glycosyltransferase involved in cell wall biosynthesis
METIGPFSPYQAHNILTYPPMFAQRLIRVLVAIALNVEPAAALEPRAYPATRQTPAISIFSCEAFQSRLIVSPWRSFGERWRLRYISWAEQAIGRLSDEGPAITITGGPLSRTNKKLVETAIRKSFINKTAKLLTGDELKTIDRLQISQKQNVEVYLIPELREFDDILVAHPGRGGRDFQHKKRRVYISPRQLRILSRADDETLNQFWSHEILGHLNMKYRTPEKQIELRYKTDLVRKLFQNPALESVLMDAYLDLNAAQVLLHDGEPEQAMAHVMRVTNPEPPSGTTRRTSLASFLRALESADGAAPLDTIDLMQAEQLLEQAKQMEIDINGAKSQRVLVQDPQSISAATLADSLVRVMAKLPPRQREAFFGLFLFRARRLLSKDGGATPERSAWVLKIADYLCLASSIPYEKDRLQELHWMAKDRQSADHLPRLEQLLSEAIREAEWLVAWIVLRHSAFSNNYLFKLRDRRDWATYHGVLDTLMFTFNNSLPRFLTPPESVDELAIADDLESRRLDFWRDVRTNTPREHRFHYEAFIRTISMLLGQTAALDLPAHEHVLPPSESAVFQHRGLFVIRKNEHEWVVRSWNGRRYWRDLASMSMEYHDIPFSTEVIPRAARRLFSIESLNSAAVRVTNWSMSPVIIYFPNAFNVSSSTERISSNLRSLWHYLDETARRLEQAGNAEEKRQLRFRTDDQGRLFSVRLLDGDPQKQEEEKRSLLEDYPLKSDERLVYVDWFPKQSIMTLLNISWTYENTENSMIEEPLTHEQYPPDILKTVEYVNGKVRSLSTDDPSYALLPLWKPWLAFVSLFGWEWFWIVKGLPWIEEIITTWLLAPWIAPERLAAWFARWHFAKPGSYVWQDLYGLKLQTIHAFFQEGLRESVSIHADYNRREFVARTLASSVQTFNFIEAACFDLRSGGGITSYLDSLNRTLLQYLPHRIHLFYPVNSNPRIFDESVGKGIVRHHQIVLQIALPPRWVLRTKLHHLWHSARVLRITLREVRVIIREEKAAGWPIDLFHLHTVFYPGLHIAFWLLSWMHQIPRVLTSHAQAPSWTLDRLNRYLLQLRIAFFSLGSPLLGVSRAALPGFMARGRTIGAGVETDDFQPANGNGQRFRETHPGVSSGRALLFYPARIESMKGQEDLLKVADYLRERRLDAQIVVMGASLSPSSVKYRETLNKEIVERHLEDRLCVLPLGTKSEIIDGYAASVGVISSSRAESFSLIAIEAAAMGIPYIGYDVGSVSKTVLNGKTGILVSPQNPQALSEAAERILTDPALRERLGYTGQIHARSAFSIETLAAKHLRLYYRLLARRTLKRAVLKLGFFYLLFVSSISGMHAPHSSTPLLSHAA